MEPNEFWILDSVVEQRHSLAMLTMENVDAIFGKDPHGMDRDAIIATLQGLFERKYLSAFNEERGEFTPTLKEIEQGLDSELDADYGLTPAGGDQWAEVAVPNWDRFVDGVFGDQDEAGEFDSITHERVGRFCCTDKAHLEKYITSIRFSGVLPHPPSLKWDTISPWQALYWKEMPSAHRVQFIGTFIPQCPPELVPKEYQDIGVWHNGIGRQIEQGDCADGTCGCG